MKKIFSWLGVSAVVGVLSVAILLSAGNVFADINFGSVTSNANSSSGASTISINKPSATVSGDLLVASVVFNGGSGKIITPPSGWTLIERTDNSTDLGMVSYYKVAGGSEPTSYSWGISPSSGSTRRAAGGIIRYTGVDTSNPIVTSDESEGNSSQADAPSVVTTAANQRVVLFFGLDDDNAMDEPSGTFERYNVDNSDDSGPRALGADFVKVSAGSTGVMTADIINSGTDDVWVAHTIVLREASIPATLTVIKDIVNDNGGSANAGDFDLFVGATEVVSGESNEFEAGSYVVSEANGPEGYSATFSGACDSSGNITLEAGGEYTCTIINNDQAAQLTIVKDAIGGDQEFFFAVTQGESTTTSPSIETEGGAGSSEVILLNAGTYSVIETHIPDGWDFTDSYCSYEGGGEGEGIENGEEITVDIGDVVTCTFKNTKRASFTLTKLTDPEDLFFKFQFDGGPGGQDLPATSTALGNEDSWTISNLLPGDYNFFELEESLPDGWTGLQWAACNAAGYNDPEGDVSEAGGGLDITLNPGDDMQCNVNNTQNGIVSGQKFEDADGIGASNTGSGLPGWTINFDLMDDPSTDAVESGNFQAITNDSGNYFIELQPGTYLVCEENQNAGGWYQSYPAGSIEDEQENVGTAICGEFEHGYSVVVEAASNTNGIDFGNFLRGTIAGTKWHDQNANGLLDELEPGLGGWTIQLFRGGDYVAEEVTSGGTYQFTEVDPGTYTLREVLQEGWTQSFPGGDGSLEVTLTSGGNVVNRNFGNLEDSSVSGMKWNDENENGQVDDGEEGLDYWRIYVDSNGNGEYDEGEPSDWTDEDGLYTISGLLPGSYSVGEVHKSGWAQTFPGGDGFRSVVLGIGEDAIDVNFGNVRSIQLTGAKWHDYNADGYQSESEPIIAEWTIFAEPITEEDGELASDGRETKELATASNGHYSFDFLPSESGWWRISEEQRDGWSQTYPTEPNYYDVFISLDGPGEEEEGPGYNAEENIYEGYDFGNWQSPIIQVVKWNDDNSSGSQNSDLDVPLELWPMALGRVIGQVSSTIQVEIVDLDLTDSEGVAELTAPAISGDYIVFEGARENWNMTYPAPRANDFEVTFAPGVEPIPLDLTSFFNVPIQLNMHGDVIDEGEIPSTDPEDDGELVEEDLEFGNHQTVSSNNGQGDGSNNLGRTDDNGLGGQVLGAATTTDSASVGSLGETCQLPLTVHLRRGGSNDPQNVRDLQNFLNVELALAPPIPLTGFFGPITESGVRAFQLKYSDEILKPWVDLGLLPANTATGIVYKTTLWKIQMLACPDLNLPQPIIP